MIKIVTNATDITHCRKEPQDDEVLRGSGTDKHHRILQIPSTQVSAVMNTLLAYQSMKILVPNKTWLYHTLRPETLNN